MYSVRRMKILLGEALMARFRVESSPQDLVKVATIGLLIDIKIYLDVNQKY